MKRFMKAVVLVLAVFLFAASLWAQSSKKISATFKNSGGSGIYQLYFYSDQSGKIYFKEEGQEYTGSFTYVLDSGNFDNGILTLVTIVYNAQNTEYEIKWRDKATGEVTTVIEFEDKEQTNKQE